MNFSDFAAIHGLDIRRLELGKIIRCPTKDHPRSDNGAFFYSGDWGWCQNWAEMSEPVYWTDDTITRPEDLAALRARMEASRKQHAQERARDAQNAAQKAKAIIKQARIEQHAYLDSKGFREAVGLVWYPDEDTNLLVIPMYVGRDVVGCQLINRDGEKKFLRGQKTNGAEFVLGSYGVEIWCEGYATALSIHTTLKAMKVLCRVHACFSAGNLQRMAKAGYVVADNDASQTGEKAAQATGLPYWMPEQTGQDFNDFHVDRGTFSAGMELRQWLQKEASSRRSNGSSLAVASSTGQR